MLASRRELLEKIRLGEDSFFELKEVKFAGGKVRGPSQDALADELAAFANHSGGTLLLGVEDTRREVVGIPLERLDAVEQVIRDACETSIKPPLAPIIERITLPDLDEVEQPVLRVEVAQSLFVHESPSGYYHRVGSSKRKIPPDQLARLFQQRSQSRLIRFDETPVALARPSDLDEGLWRRFAPANSEDDATVLQQKLAILGKDHHGVLRPTVSGVLMATQEPRRFLHAAYIQAVAYAGNTPVPEGDSRYQRDAQDITGPLDRQILDACAFVAKNARVAARKAEGGGRVDLPEYSMRAVFEAIVNAVAHRDYSMPGTKVRLKMYRDRLEIYSPGALPNSMRTEDLAFRQSARNEALASLLARCPVPETPMDLGRRLMMDKRGEGVPIILAESERISRKKPVYVTHGDELALTLFAAMEEDEP